jgi:hypothetical protein
MEIQGSANIELRLELTIVTKKPILACHNKD